MMESLGQLVQREFFIFISSFTPFASIGNTHEHGRSIDQRVYRQQLEDMIERERSTLYVDFAHLERYSETMARAIMERYYELEQNMANAILQYYIERQGAPHPKLATINFGQQTRMQRQKLNGNATAANGGQANVTTEFNPFHVSFFNIPVKSTLRELRMGKLGHLMAINGTVTRTSQVRPELVTATFVCDDCATEIRNVKQQFKYTEPIACINPVCQNRKKFTLQLDSCHLVDWQSVRVQENADEIPAGSMPRTIKVVLRNEIVEAAKPGDKCEFVGTLLVVPDVAQLLPGRMSDRTPASASQREHRNFNQGVSGVKELGVRDLSYSLVFMANNVRSLNSVGVTIENQEEVPLLSADDNERNVALVQALFTPQEVDRLREMNQHPNIYQAMSRSLAPNICGHEDIKKGILLMLLGGVHKVNPADKQQLRGDINVCLVGDPSVSKSQFLKYVHGFLPRAVYTSGKASSAAGLTATVVRDAESGEYAIEAGALMLADNGICCIDEFDKMDIADQVAIHEAMEQQTISISKAGIQATLNARTSILAAANPIGGRYDRTKTLKQNVDISAPIMSRFDLFFVILDDNNEAVDFKVARHIINIHQHLDNASERPEFSKSEMQNYVRFAKMHRPELSPKAKRLLVHHYANLRAGDSAGNANKGAYRITVRQLESMIRLAEAYAKLELSDTVNDKHVNEAARLLRKSIVHVESEDIELEDDDDFANGESETHLGDVEQNENDNDQQMKSDISNGDKATSEAVKSDVDEEHNEAPAQSSNIDSDVNVPVDSAKQRKKIELSFVEYQRITNLIVHHLRELEVRTHKIGDTQRNIINWYVNLEVEEQSISDEATLAETAKIVRLVIKRLVKQDRVLLVFNDKGSSQADRILYVHPNYTSDVEMNEQSLQDVASPEEQQTNSDQ